MNWEFVYLYLRSDSFPSYENIQFELFNVNNIGGVKIINFL